MIQIFEIIQESSNGWWSDYKDFISGFGVIISTIISSVGAYISIKTLRINKNTLVEIQRQRIESYQPDLIPENKFYIASKSNNLQLETCDELLKKTSEQEDCIYLKNIGLGVAKNIKITVFLSLEDIINKNKVYEKFEGSIKIDNEFTTFKEDILKKEYSNNLIRTFEIPFIEPLHINSDYKFFLIDIAFTDKLKSLLENISKFNIDYQSDENSFGKMTLENNYIEFVFFDIGGKEFKSKFKMPLMILFSKKTPNYLSIRIKFKRINLSI